MKQNIYYKTQIDSLVKTLKLDVKDSPYFIGSSSQATIQRSSTDCSEFSAALVFCDSEWKIIRFAEEEHSSEFATLSSTNLNPKAILERIDALNSISLKSMEKIVAVKFSKDNEFLQISKYDTISELQIKTNCSIKISLNQLANWQIISNSQHNFYIKKINFNEKLFHLSSSDFKITKVYAIGLIAFLLGSSMLTFVKNDSILTLPQTKTYKTLSTVQLAKIKRTFQKSNPQQSNIQNIASDSDSPPPTASSRISSLASSLGRLSLLSKNSISKSTKNLSIQNTANNNFGKSLSGELSVGGASGTSQRSKFFAGGSGGSSTGRNIAGLVGDGGALVDLIDKETKASEGLDKEEIAKVIKKNLGQVLYCYERQLSANSQLFGKITVQFQIDQSGKVEFQKVAESSINDKQMEACVLGKISKFTFPQPKDGMKVLVNYPFIFKSIQ